MAEWIRAHVRKHEVVGSIPRAGQVRILGRNDTDSLDEQVEGLIARAEVVSQ